MGSRKRGLLGRVPSNCNGGLPGDLLPIANGWSSKFDSSFAAAAGAAAGDTAAFSDALAAGRGDDAAGVAPFFFFRLSFDGIFGAKELRAYRGDSNCTKVQLNINSKALVAHIDRVV